MYLLTSKSNAMTVFLEFYNMIFTQYNTAIKSVRSQNALELAFHDFFSSKGIVSFHSCVETP